MEFSLTFFLLIIIYLLYRIYQSVTNQKDIGRDYARYPVFPHEQIEEAQKELRSLSDEYREHIDKVTSMGKLARKDKKAVYHRDFSNEFKAMVRKSFSFQEEENFKRKRYFFMIEGNIAVLNGHKKIEEVLDEYDRYLIGEWDFGKDEKDYNKWLNERVSK